MSWKTLRFDGAPREGLDDLVITAERFVDLPGQRAQPTRLNHYEASLRALWEHLDGWRVFVPFAQREDSLVTLRAQRGDLPPRARLILGVDDDRVTVADIPGFFDGERSAGRLIVPVDCLDDDTDTISYDHAAHESHMKRVRKARRAFAKRMLADTPQKPAHLRINNGDFQALTGIVVPDPAGVQFEVKCDGVACRYAGATGGLLDDGNTDWDWLKIRALHRTIGDNTHRNAAHGGGFNVELFNAVLPDGWRVDERYVDAAVEAWVPVVGPDNRPGALTWPNSD